MPASKRPTLLRRLVTAVGLCGIAAYVLLPPLSRTAAARRLILDLISGATQYDVRIEDLGAGYDLSLFARAVSVAAPGREPFLVAENLRFAPTLWRVWQGRIGDVEITAPNLYVDRMESRAAGKSQAPRPSLLGLLGVEVKGGFLHHERDGNAVAIGPADLTLSSIKSGDSLELSGGTRLGQAEIHWTGTLGFQTGFFVARVGATVADLRDLLFDLTGKSFPDSMTTTSGRALLAAQGELQGRIGGTLEAELRRASYPEIVEVGGNLQATLAPTNATAQVNVTIDPALPPIAINATVQPDDAGVQGWDARIEARDLPVNRLQAWLAPDGLDVEEGTLDALVHAAGSAAEAEVDGRLNVRGARVESDGWEATADAVVPFRFRNGTLTFDDTGLRADDINGHFGDFAWQVGRFAARGEVDGILDGAVVANLKASVSEVGLHDQDYLRAAQGVEADAAITVRRPTDGAPELEAEVSSRKGELLWDRFYVALSNRPAKLRGRARVENDVLVLRDLRAALEGVGRIEGEVRYDAGKGEHEFTARVETDDLDGLFQVGVRDAFKESYPSLLETKVGGRLRARVSGSGGASGTPSMEAKIDVEDASFQIADPQVRVADLNVDLPILIGKAAPKGAPLSGRIAFGSLDLGGVAVDPFRLDLRVGPDRLALAAPVDLRLLNGTVEIEKLALARQNGSLPNVDLGLTLQHLDLAGLTAAMRLPPLSGTITGRIPEVRLVDRSLRSDAEIGVQVFGGEVRVRNLKLEEIFSPVPALALDVDFHNISLGDLTEAFDVGHVTGIADGAVHDLVMVAGQPVSFEAWLETVKRSGVDQRISVTAIRQISILGGAGGDAITQGILSFFDDYGYAKMGFHARLENDRFYLRGVQSEDGKEVLVVGSTLPPRVNVVSHSQVISFSEMVKRLSQAFQDRQPQVNGK